MLYFAPDKLTLLPFPQSWDGTQIALRAVVLPRGTPMGPLLTAVPGLGDAPAFADGTIRLSALIIPSLDRLPNPADVTATVDLAMISPPDRRPLFEAVAAQFTIDPTIEANTRNPRRSDRVIKKLLVSSYRRAFAFAGPRTPFAVLGEEYACAMRRGCQLGKPPTPPPASTTSWGRILSQCLRQPLLAERMGLLFAADLVLPDSALFKSGGWLYLALQAGSDYADHALAQPSMLAAYAARIPALTAPRGLFAPVLYPVSGVPPLGAYDDIFAETVGYDDGFAKIVHCAQQTSGIPIGLESAEDRYRGAPPPVRDTGIQLGWDDEQLLVWTNRQIADPMVETRQAPMVIRGFRVDVREAGETTWHTMMRVEAELAIGGRDIGDFEGELNVEVGPLQFEDQEDGDFWMPAYFTQWQGRSLIAPDTVGLKLSGQGAPGARYRAVGDRAVALRYGRGYEFRVRLSDLSNGGPAPEAEPANPAPTPVGRCDFRRFVPPGLPQIEGVPDVPDPMAPPSSLSIRRPGLGYPAAIYTGAPDAEARLIAHAEAISATGTGDIPMIPDPDVAMVEITVAVGNLRFDSLNDGEGVPPLRTLYTKNESFPVDPTHPLSLTLNWVDVKDATTLAPSAAGTLDLPRARGVVISVRAVGREDATLAYFGSESARFGDPTTVTLSATGTDERAFFVPEVPQNQLRAILLRPQEKETEALRARLRAVGRGVTSETSPLHLLAEELDLETSGRALWAPPGRRIIFACAPSLAHVTSPDGSAITFSSQSDLTDRWLAVITVSIDRDWTWHGDARVALEIARDGAGAIGRVQLPRSVNPEVFQTPERAGAPVDRGATHIVYIDAIDPKPIPPAHPQELSLAYTLTPRFALAPTKEDPPLKLSVNLPIASPPTQTPKLLSAGIASAAYARSDDYATTKPRDRMLWLEFEAPSQNPADTYFCRVLSSAPDPMLTREAPVAVPPEPPLPIDPEFIRVVRPGQPDDQAGMAAMQRMLPTTSNRHFLVPLPPGLTRDSLDLHGFFTYELRLGHAKGWSTARGRFGPALRVTGVQHPPPALACQAFRTQTEIRASAPFATPVYEGRSVIPPSPGSTIWIILYAQVVQADAADRRNILLSRKKARYRRKREVQASVALAGDARWSQAEVEAALAALGLPEDSPLSVLAAELLPELDEVADPLGGDLGSTRVLRTSPLVRVPPICAQPPCLPS